MRLRRSPDDSDVAARRPDDRRVDTDQLPFQVDQRAARVAGIDRCVGLDEVLVALDAQAAAAERRNDSRSHRLPDAEGIADRHREIAHVQVVGIAESERAQALGGNAQYGDVGSRIGAHQARLERSPVLQRHHDFLGVLDHVMVGEHDALARVDDHAGARALLPSRLVRQIEESPEKRIPEKGIPFGRIAGGDRDVHHRRGDPGKHGREAGHASVRRKRNRLPERILRSERAKQKNKRQGPHGFRSPGVSISESTPGSSTSSSVTPSGWILRISRAPSSPRSADRSSPNRRANPTGWPRSPR